MPTYHDLAPVLASVAHCPSLPERDPARPPGHAVWQSRTVTDLATAEALMDWLEATGTTERELVLGPVVTVRWR